jgi:hypothetical protein
MVLPGCNKRRVLVDNFHRTCQPALPDIADPTLSLKIQSRTIVVAFGE